jgi:hypothetical protein
MSPNLTSIVVFSFILALVQAVAALPWLCALDPVKFGREARRPGAWMAFLGAVVGLTIVLVAIINFRNDPEKLTFDGRVYASILQLQLRVDFVVIVLAVMLWLWPKGGTVALAAFREGYRQPMFWLIGGLIVLILIVSMVIPYFTLGEDFKMMKLVSFDMIKLSATLFVVLAAAISISEEIEGRTAVTLMSKPVTRRQFLLGKYFGILLAGILLTLILSWFQNWVLYIKPRFDRLEDSFDPIVVEIQGKITARLDQLNLVTEPKNFLNGIGLWFGETAANMCGLMLGIGMVAIMLAIATACATRLSMVVTVVVCLIVFVMGNLAPVIADESRKLAEKQGAALGLVTFLAQLADKMLPSLYFFSTDQTIIRETHLPPGPYALYSLSVLGYSLLYAAMALLVGLFLIEDRDLA